MLFFATPLGIWSLLACTQTDFTLVVPDGGHVVPYIDGAARSICEGRCPISANKDVPVVLEAVPDDLFAFDRWTVNHTDRDRDQPQVTHSTDNPFGATDISGTITVRFAPEGQIRGRVTLDGKPWDGVGVRLTRQGDTLETDSTRTDAAGRYLFSRVGTARFVVDLYSQTSIDCVPGPQTVQVTAAVPDVVQDFACTSPRPPCRDLYDNYLLVRDTLIARQLCPEVFAPLDNAPTVYSDGLQTRAKNTTHESVRALAAMQAPTVAAAALNPGGAYACDQPNVLCTSAAPAFAEAPTLLLANITHGDVPLADGTNHYQYGFVFDADDDPDNNYVASSSYPADFFDGTDRWYVANYTPSNGWTLDVTDARNGGFVDVPDSSARVILEGDSLILVVLASEFPASHPLARLSVFRHTGDWGAGGNWDGDVQPSVAQGLLDWAP